MMLRVTLARSRTTAATAGGGPGRIQNLVTYLRSIQAAPTTSSR